MTQPWGANPQNYPDYGGHPGVDYATPLDTPLTGPASTVLHAGLDVDWPGRGRYVVLEWGPYYLYYMHLNITLVHRGQVIEENTQIGLTGNSGWSTGPHLHIGIQDQRNINSPTRGFIDPLSLIG